METSDEAMAATSTRSTGRARSRRQKHRDKIKSKDDPKREERTSSVKPRSSSVQRIKNKLKDLGGKRKDSLNGSKADPSSSPISNSYEKLSIAGTKSTAPPQSEQSDSNSSSSNYPKIIQAIENAIKERKRAVAKCFKQLDKSQPGENDLTYSTEESAKQTQTESDKFIRPMECNNEVAPDDGENASKESMKSNQETKIVVALVDDAGELDEELSVTKEAAINNCKGKGSRPGIYFPRNDDNKTGGQSDGHLCKSKEDANDELEAKLPDVLVVKYSISGNNDKVSAIVQKNVLPTSSERNDTVSLNNRVLHVIDDCKELSNIRAAILHVEAKNTDNQSEVKKPSPPPSSCNDADKGHTFSSQKAGKKEQQEMLLVADFNSCKSSSSFGRTEKFETLVVGQHSDSPQKNSDLQSTSVDAEFHTETNEIKGEKEHNKKEEEVIKMNYFRKRFSFVGTPASQTGLPVTPTSEAILRDVRNRRRRGHLDDVVDSPRLVGERRRRRSSVSDYALPDQSTSIVEKYCSKPEGDEDKRVENIEMTFNLTIKRPEPSIVDRILCEAKKSEQGESVENQVEREPRRRRRRDLATPSDPQERRVGSAANRRRRRDHCPDPVNSDSPSRAGSKPGSLRRRRRPPSKPSDGDTGTDDDNPFTKRTLQTEKAKEEITDVQPDPHPADLRKSSVTRDFAEIDLKDELAPATSVISTAEVPKKPLVEVQVASPDFDPMKFMEIKSAVQWKELNERISWKFDDKENIEKKPTTAPNTDKVTPTRAGVQKKVNQSQTKRRDEITYDLKKLVFPVDPDGFMPTKIQQLRLVCWRMKPWNNNSSSRGSSRLFNSQFAIQWGVDCDEIHPGLFIGDKASASNVQFLKKYGITHVLNAAEGKDEGLVDLHQSHYDGSGITYLGFPLWDNPDCNILPYLGCAADYIEIALKNGKCLVNCQMGVSRSASCAMAYLMVKEGFTSVEALTTLRKGRDCRPNDGFLEQIVQLDNDLRRFRDHEVPMSICLSKLDDVGVLPFPWHKEFWSKPMTEQEVGMPIVSLGSSRPLSRHSSFSKASKSSSRVSSFRSSRNLSSKHSKRNSICKTSTSLSRGSSFKISKAESKPECEDEVSWEWTWEEEEEEEEEQEEQHQKEEPRHLAVTTQKLEVVKNIIEKPEEYWRVNKEEAPPLPDTQLHQQVQQGLEEANDVLSLFKVGSAKQWKELSKNLVVNVNTDQTDEQDISKEEFDRPVTPSSFKPTKAQQLRLLCWKIKPWDEVKDKRLFTSMMAAPWGVDCDEVYPNIFIGDEASARNIQFLRKMGITHVLNTAEGVWTDHSFVDLTAAFYEGTGIEYQGLQLWDHPNVKILPYLGCADEFISLALSGGGKCLVHCQMGVSRSATCAIAYMMLTQGQLAVDVFRLFRKRRDIRPNDYYLDQIVELDNDLRKERELGIPRKIGFKGLAEIDSIPKPWHFEFWKAIPTDETLPFALTSWTDPTAAAAPASSISQLRPKKYSSKRHSRLSANDVSNRQSQMSEWEWEYYSQSDDDERRSLYVYGED